MNVKSVINEKVATKALMRSFFGHMEASYQNNAESENLLITIKGLEKEANRIDINEEQKAAAAMLAETYQEIFQSLKKSKV